MGTDDRSQAQRLADELNETIVLWPPELRAAFHHLWSKSVGTEGYDKEEWKRLEKMIEGLLSLWKRKRAD